MAPPPKKRPSTDELLRKWEADKKSRIFLQLAEEYRKQDFVDAAVSVLKDGLKHHPNFQPAHVALARCHMSKGQLTEAQTELERVHSKSKDNLLAGKLLVEVLEQRGEKSRALEVAQELVPFAAFDDPEVEATAKRLEAELAAPTVRGGGSSTSTGTAGDTMDFGGGEFASDSTQDVVTPMAGDDDEAMLIDADAFSEEEPEAAMPPPLPPPAAAFEPEAADGDSTRAELDADSTHDELAAASADATHDELAAVGREPASLSPMPGSEAGSPEDLLGGPEPVAASSGDDDLTSITLAELYEAQDSPHEAAAIYEKLLERRPEDAELRAALERCRVRIEGAATGETTVADVQIEPPAETSSVVPKWEPAPAAPAPAAATTEAADETSPEQWKAILAEYDRWLTAVRAVAR